MALRAAVVINADRHAADLAEAVADIRATEATSLRAMAEALTRRGALTSRGGQWQVSSVRNLIRRIGDQKPPNIVRMPVIDRGFT